MLRVLQRGYQKYHNCITNWIFPMILLWYPLVKINQGIDVSDATYSLSNYLYFERLEGTWVISTYLSNVVGFLLTKLPFGTTLLGMNLYTGLLVSALALSLYALMRKWMPDWIVFAGEFIAIGFLWIPTVILYNYMTYLLFSLGAVILCKGLEENRDRLLVLAGILLGVNVWVRIPNLAEMALIVCVWYYCWINTMEKTQAFKKTGWCILGYGIGIVIPLIMVFAQYGFGGIAEMINGLFQIQSKDDTYSLFSMVSSVAAAYARTAKWIFLILMGIGLGMAMFGIRKQERIVTKKLIYLGGIAVLLRFFWGRGMFSFRYYEDYTSMYEWGMVGLYMTLFACMYLLLGKGVALSERLWGMLSLIVLLITPLGSNNYTYQNLNNLFLNAPITLYAFVKLFRRRYSASKRIFMYPWKSMAAVLGAMILIQSIGFHFGFVFRDGMDGTPRDTLISAPAVVAHMKTTGENAEMLGGLLTFMQENTEVAEKRGQAEELGVIYFGDCPGLPFLLQLPSALDSSWPDLDSFSIEQMRRNLEELSQAPVIIMRHTMPTSQSFTEKKELLQEYMRAKLYEIIYENDGYTVYCPL